MGIKIYVRLHWFWKLDLHSILNNPFQKLRSMYNGICTLYSGHENCTVNIEHCTEDIVQLTLYIVQWKLYIVQLTLLIVQWTLLIVQWTLYISHYTVIFVHWLLYIIHWDLYFTSIFVHYDSILAIITHLDDQKLAFVRFDPCLYGGQPPWQPFLWRSVFSFTCVSGENPRHFTLEIYFIVLKSSKFSFEYIDLKNTNK